MSNYLNHLVVRSLNLVQTVQPRLPSRFEVPTGLAESVGGQAQNWEQNAVSTFSDEATQEVQWETRTERREDGGEEERVTWHPNTTRFNFPLASLNPLPQALSIPPTPLSKGGRGDGERGKRGEEIELGREDRSISPVLPASPYQEGEKEDTGDRGQQNPIERSPIRRQAKQTQDEHSSAAEFIQPTSQNLASKIVSEEQQFLPHYESEIKNLPAENALSSTTTSPQPSGDGSRETSPKEPVRLDSPFNSPRSAAIAPPLPTPSFQAPTPPPPTIQVTIGRIEVRATPPPTTPQRQGPAPPKMSLNEYLQQQKPGGRA